MKKRIFTLLLATCLLLINCCVIYAGEVTINTDEQIMHMQAESIIARIDENVLLLDAMNDVVDDNVPQAIREGIATDAVFIPAEGINPDEVEVTVHTTVQRVGELRSRSGDIANMYVAVAAFEVKEDINMSSDSGVRAWAYVYWVDNKGVNNELYAARGQWDPGDKVISDRVVKYGVADPTGVLLWLDGPTTKYPTVNDAQYFDYGKYTGYKLKCQTEVNIVNIGTLRASVTSHWLT